MKKRNLGYITLVIYLLSAGITSLIARNNNRWGVQISAGQTEAKHTYDSNYLNYLTTTNLYDAATLTPDKQLFLQVMGAKSTIPRKDELKQTHVRVLFERLFLNGKHLGVELGINGSQSRLSCFQNCGEYGQIAVLGISGLPDDTVKLYQALSDGVIEKPAVYNLHTGGMEFGLSWHFRPDATVDPYLGLGAEGGLMGGAFTGQFYGGQAKAGLRFNTNSRFYVFIEGTGRSTDFRLDNSYKNIPGSILSTKESRKIHRKSSGASAGVGFRW